MNSLPQFFATLITYLVLQVGVDPVVHDEALTKAQISNKVYNGFFTAIIILMLQMLCTQIVLMRRALSSLTLENLNLLN